MSLNEYVNYTMQQVVEIYSKELVQYVYKMTGSIQDSEEIVQNALLNAYDSLKKGTKPLNLKSWVYRYTYNEMINVLKRKGIHKKVMQQYQEEAKLWTDSFQKMNQEVAEAIDTLEGYYRQVITLRFISSLKIEEIADVLEIPPGSVKSYISRGLKILKERLAHILEGTNSYEV